MLVVVIIIVLVAFVAILKCEACLCCCRYLQRVVSHPSLLQDPDVREFLEKEEVRPLLFSNLKKDVFNYSAHSTVKFITLQ